MPNIVTVRPDELQEIVYTNGRFKRFSQEGVAPMLTEHVAPTFASTGKDTDNGVLSYVTSTLYKASEIRCDWADNYPAIHVITYFNHTGYP